MREDNLQLNAVFLLLLSVLLLTGSNAVIACTQHGFGLTTLEKYERSELVVIAKGLSVEKVKDGERTYSLFGVRSIKMGIEKVFKGNYRIGDEIILVEGNGSDYVDSFRESDVGRSYLLFICSRKEKPNTFQVLRGMNDWLTDEKALELRYHENRAAEDLLYLEKMDRLRGKTRIYGRIGINQDSYALMGKSSIRVFRNVQVRISGNGKSYKMTTNGDGVYEVYDLPAGRYSISPEIPKGWKITNASSFGKSGGDNTETNFQVTLKAGKHAFYRYDLEATNTVSGKVIDPFGNPMDGVCLELLPVAGKSSNSFLTNDCTIRDGVFSFEQIVGGDYLIIVNKDNQISSREPFPTAYYPNGFEREKAGIIKVIEGENQSGIILQIPQIRETFEVSGKLLSADGLAVVNARITFSSNETGTNIDGSAIARTDDEGKFSIKILKGVYGVLTGVVTLDVGQFAACPQIIDQISKYADYYLIDKKSNAVKIETDKDLDKVVLNLSFPSCNGKKIVSRIIVD